MPNANLLIIFRHGRRKINTGELSGDGPLTPDGIEDVKQSAYGLVDDILKMPYMEWHRKIDLAVVSGSIRCAQTFAIIWDCMMRSGMGIGEYDMRKEYFSTREEDVGWNELYTKRGLELRRDAEALGEKEAVLKHAGKLVWPCAERTIQRLDAAFGAEGHNSILLVTHAPHDCLIEKHFSVVGRKECLEQGRYWTLVF